MTEAEELEFQEQVAWEAEQDLVLEVGQYPQTPLSPLDILAAIALGVGLMYAAIRRDSQH